MNKNIVIASLLFISAGILLTFFGPASKKEYDIRQNQQENLGEATITIVRTDTGYVPNEITIKRGDVVLWKNESSEYHWPASDIHPTHGVYPAFDPLRPISPGEEWKFRFDQVGEWKFHDHIRANKIGMVTVVQ